MIVTNSLSGGGAERSMNLLCNILTSRGWTVSLIPINSSNEDLVELDCQVFPINRIWKGGVVNSFKSFWSFNQIVHDWNPEIVILNCDLPELFGALMLSRKQLIAVEHINHPWKGRRLLGRIVRFILRLRSVKWIAVSNHFFIWPGNKSPAKVIKNSINQGSHKVSSNLFMERNIALKRLIFIGRLAPQKRPDRAIEVASACKIRLEIFGTGKQENYLRQLAQSLGMNAHFNSYRSDLWELIEVGDLLLVPSEYEGDGLVVVEGLSAGIPMLISDIPDFRRFGFPDINYCGSLEEFMERISLHKDSLENLLIPRIIADSILQERSSISVGDSWEEFFRNCFKIDS